MRPFLIALVCLGGAPADAQPPPPQTPDPAARVEERVDVIAVTPVHGIGLPVVKFPSNVQVYRADELRGSFALDVPAFLSTRATSVQVSQAQGGTFQPDLIFRGYSASPLLGASEGLAIFQNGVRMNDPFGDVIAWDVLPALAVASMNLMPGSNPLFGLNALGGALSVRTKNGFEHPIRHATVSTGAFGRHRVDAEAGGGQRALAYYVSASLTSDDGWRDFSPSVTRRLFADLGWRGAMSSMHVNVTAASNDLRGNGAAPASLLERDRTAVFTHPDDTDTNLALVTMTGRRSITASLSLDGVAYVRRSSIRTFNGDADDDPDSEEEMEFGAVNNRSRTRGTGGGFTAQVTSTGPLGGGANHLVLGGGMDAAATRFGFTAERAELTADRGTIGTGIFEDDEAVDLRTRVLSGHVFASETWSATERLGLTAAARVNWASLRLRDQIGTALDGDHSFARINPSAGVTYQAHSWLNLFGGYTVSSRVPTPVELTCADPGDPCRLPNAFVADPPLDQVVARTWEAGARGRTAGLSWAAAVFASAASDDIIFVSSGTLRGEGHFENVKKTRRQGIEVSAEYQPVAHVTMFISYTRQSATFGTDLTVASPMHPDAEANEIFVPAGARIPAVPRHSGRIGLAARLMSRLQAGALLQAQSDVPLRGDEANLLSGVPGFARVDAQARFAVTRRVSLVGHVQNLFDARYNTFGVVGDAGILESDADEYRFYSPGEPRGAWVGVAFDF